MILPRSLGTMAATLVATSLLAGVGLSQEEGKAGPKLNLSVERIEFGRLARGQSAVREVEITNSGDEPLRIRRVGVNCGCATLQLATPTRLNVPIDTKDEGRVKLQIQPGKTATLTVRVDTTRLDEGITSKHCLIFTNDKSQSKVSLPLAMEVEAIKGPPVPEPTRPANLIQPPSRPTNQPPSSPARLSTDRAEHNFGEILRGEKSTCEFVIENPLDEDIKINFLRNSCSCTASKLAVGDQSWSGEELTETKELTVLKAGQKAHLEVELDTSGVVRPGTAPQPMHKSILIYHDDNKSQPLRLMIHADVLNPVSFEPNSLRFGRVRRGAGATMSTVMRATNLENFEIEGIKVGRPEALDASFKLIEGESERAYEISVALKPGASIGRITDPLKVQLNHPRVKELSVPLFVDVGPDVVFQGNDPHGAERLDFKILTAEEDASLDLVIENFDPEVPYVPESIELTARPTTDPFSYELTEVEKGKKYIVRLTVSKDITSRYFSGKLRITSQHPDIPVKLIDFRGWLSKPVGEATGK